MGSHGLNLSGSG